MAAAQPARKQLENLNLGYPLPPAKAFQVDLSKDEFEVLVLTGLSFLAAGGAGKTPSVVTAAASQTLSTIRNSCTAANLLIYNHGPNPVYLSFGANAVVGASSMMLNKDDAYETPAPVTGKVTAICAEGQTAALAITTF